MEKKKEVVLSSTGSNLSDVCKKVNFNMKDFYEAIQPVTDFYTRRLIIDTNEPHRSTPKLVDISEKWEVEEYTSSDPEGTGFKNHIDAVDDLFTLLYSFKGVLDRYPKGADYSTPGLKTTFELLWGEVWAYYVTIPRVTFSWVYHDILHCIKAAGGRDWTGYIEGEVPARLTVPESIIPEVKEEPIEERIMGLPGFTDGMIFTKDPKRFPSKVEPDSTTEVPQGYQDGLGGGGFRDREMKPKDLPQIQDALKRELNKIGEKPVTVDNSKIDALERLRKVLKELDSESGKIYNRILTHTEIIPDLKIYTGRPEIPDEPLKSNIHLLFKQVYGEPRLYQRAYDFEDHSAPYYLAKIAVDDGGELVRDKIKSKEGYQTLKETITHFISRPLEPFNYLYTQNTFAFESQYLLANVKGIVSLFMITDLSSYFASLLEKTVDRTIFTLETTWKVYCGVYKHFDSAKVQDNMQQYITESTKDLLSGVIRTKKQDIQFNIIVPNLKQMIEGPPLTP